MIRALIFDFDGLILDTETPMFSAWDELYREAGLVITPRQWSKGLGSSSDPVAAYELLEAHLGRPVDRAALRARREVRESALLAREVPCPGVREVLREARMLALPCAIASSSERAWIEGHLARFGLRPFFTAVVSADDVRETKPAPDLYHAALCALGVGASDAIAFEDSTHGVEAAKRAGIFCVAVPNRVTRGGDFSRADLVLSAVDARPLAALLGIASAGA